MSVETLEQPRVAESQVLETKVSMLENKKQQSGPIVDPAKVKTLDPLAKAIWQKIAPRDGTLALYGDVGETKSATFTSMCEHLGIKYIRKDLATMDESDLSGIPNKRVSKTGLSYVENLLPQYIVDAIESDVPVLIVFEEVNRCNPYTRAASLGVINEKIVSNVLLPSHVFIAAALNIGDAYESEIEDIGLAMKNRFIWQKFEIRTDSWIERFGRTNAHPYVVKYLEANPQNAKFSRRELKGDELAFETFRTWTFLSSYLKQFDTVDEIIEAVQGTKVTKNGITEYYGGAECYVGQSEKSNFLAFLETMKSVTPTDILNNLPKFESILNKMSAPERLQILENFKGNSVNHYDLNNLSTNQYKNLKRFMLNYIEADVLVGFIDEVTRLLTKELSNPMEMKKLGFVKFLREPEFRDLNKQIVSVYKSSIGKNMVN
jgi:DNA modification methylase